MSYFTNFDTIYYDIKGVKGKKQFTEMKNILKRVRMKTGFIQNRVYYSDYNVIDGETGWVVGKRNRRLLAEKIMDIISLDVSELNKIRKNAINRVNKEFNLG